MGVTVLWSPLEGNSQIYQDIKFSNSELVVDGCNLAYHLYNMANLDQNHGRGVPRLPGADAERPEGAEGSSASERQTAGLQPWPERFPARCCPKTPTSTFMTFQKGFCPWLPSGNQLKTVRRPAVKSTASYYTTTKFCTVFNVDPQLLPIFASLVKVDHVKLRDVKTDRTTEDTSTAATALIPNVSQDAQAEVRNMLRESVLEYELPSSSLDWLLERKTLRIQVESCDLQGSHLTSRPIRRVLYGLLLGQGGGGG
ncbi:unnamed protein product [Arctogadus glacialis]